ncbi:HIT family protein [Macrococcus lamae]|uniref:HIT family protein n=1 Tax=Macrococcus lamae TaxID=198484 RepID=A0A4R6BUE3_9STAP|nr:HIT family protein [Macrococcus lamae]TDM11920.1 HIT family protein [Macrococcus lamae]
MNHCIFCQDITDQQVLTQTEFFKVVYDIDPIQMGHLLIISNHHYMNISELPKNALVDLVMLEQQLTALLESHCAYGVTIVSNNGRVMDDGTHFHVHLIPRYQNDGFWDHVVVEEWPMDLNHLTEELKLYG